MLNVTKTLKTKLANTATRFKKSEAGNFGVMMAVTSAVLVAGLAVSIDAANGYHAKQRLQDSTDAIALLAAKGQVKTQADLDAVANEYLDAKFIGKDGLNIRLENITRDGDLVTVTATNKIPTYFTGIFGTSGLDIAASSQALYADKKIEISLVLDSTGSMKGAKLASLKVAANNLVGQLEAGVANDKLKMSVVPFAQYVNVGPNNVNANWVDLNNGVAPNSWTGCVGSRAGSLDERVDVNGLGVPAANLACPTPLSPLTNDLNKTRNSISDLKADGWTYLPAGLMWGWRTLDSRAPFQEAAPTRDTTTEKIMIVMTDGANTRSKSGEFHEGKSENDANNKAETLCSRIKDDNITVYTIAYEVDDVKTENLMRNCATNANKYFDAASASELKEAFDVIAASLTELRLTA